MDEVRFLYDHTDNCFVLLLSSIFIFPFCDHRTLDNQILRRFLLECSFAMRDRKYHKATKLCFQFLQSPAQERAFCF